jgi:uncharacterized protein YcbX
MKVKDIIIYPIKSIGGIHLQTANCTEMGLEFDRRMMLADSNGQFITQREFPILSTLGAKLEKDGFVFYDKNNEDNLLRLPHAAQLMEEDQVKVWNHEFKARKLASEFSNWFSDFVNEKVFLYKMTEESLRYKSLIKAPGKTKLSMADGYPYLMLSEASLNDLNNRLDHPVDMDRFRANIVLEESQACEEETLDKITVGSVAFRMIKPCARCSMITINQKTAEKLVEPLKTLSLYKKKGNKVYFGMNAVALTTGKIKVGDKVTENI